MLGASNTKSTRLHDQFVAFGSNQPLAGQAPEAIARSFVERLEEPGRIDVTAVSRLYRTPAFPADSGPDFVNGVLALRSALEPQALLSALHRVEAAYGRERSARWGPRTLDLDLLASGGRVLPNAATEARWRAMGAAEAASQTPPTLILPHPRLAERAFVLVPLAELAPDWRHPATGRSAAEMLADLDPADRAAVRPLPARPRCLRRASLGAAGRRSAATRHLIGGTEAGTIYALEILRTPGTWGVELVYLDAAGEKLTDTWHACLADALAQAEAEFHVSAADWQPGPPGSDA